MSSVDVTKASPPRRSASARVFLFLRLGRRRTSTVAPYLFLLPGFALFSLVMLWPTIRALIISLYDWKVIPGAYSPFVGLDNYTHALQDPIFWRSLVNSGIYMAVTVPAQVVLGLAIAVLLHARLPGRTAFRVLFYLPVVTSWVVVSLLFRFLFSSEGGLVNTVLYNGVHLLPGDVSWLQSRWTALTAICALGIWKGVGWSMLIFLAALSTVPRELEEAAAIDGAGSWRRFLHVSLPAIRRSVLFVTVLLVIGGFNVFISVQLMTNGGPMDSTQVPLTYMYRQAFNFLDFGYGSALSFMLTAIVLALSLGQFWLFGRRGGDES